MSKRSLEAGRQVSTRNLDNPTKNKQNVVPIKRIWPSAQKLCPKKFQLDDKASGISLQKPELCQSVLLQSKKVNHQIWPQRLHEKCQQKQNTSALPNIATQQFFIERFVNQQKEHIQKDQIIKKTQNQENIIKLVLIGDSKVGKTCMLTSYTSDQFPTEHNPTVFDNYLADIKFQNKLIKLQLWDTAGEEQFATLRLKSYEKADVFFICFSLIDVKSFDNALEKWLSQAQQVNPKAIKMIIGTKEDIHNEYLIDVENAYLAIPFDYIKMKCQEKGCIFMACSGLTQKGLYKSFDEAMSRVLNGKDKKNKEQQSCKII